MVDDEEHVRAVGRGMLEAAGYSGLDTGDPHQALRIARERPLDLLVTDVVMPLMKGTDLANRVQSVSGSTKVLPMSAYDVSGVRPPLSPGYCYVPDRTHGRAHDRTPSSSAVNAEAETAS